MDERVPTPGSTGGGEGVMDPSRRCVLVLTRKVGEALWIGDDVEVRIVSVRGRKVRVAIEAPHDVAVRRSELASPGPRPPRHESPDSEDERSSNSNAPPTKARKIAG